MQHYEFLGLPQSQWEFINTFADWFSAIGTILAVWISLWLAREATRPKARITASVMMAVDLSGMSPKFIDITVANTGDKPFTVTSLGWRVGLPFFRKYAFQKIDGAPLYVRSDGLPMELQLGRSGSWRIDLSQTYEGQTWAQDFSNKFFGKLFLVELITLRVQAATSTGHVFSSKPSKDLLRKLREARINRL